MKVFLAFVSLIAAISATSLSLTPSDFTDERLVTGNIENTIRQVSQSIRDAGLDPYHIEKESSSYELPVPVLFNYEAIIEDILSTGLSNIKINRLSYSVSRSRLRYDLELPLVSFSLGSAKADAEIFSNKLDFSASGKIDVVSIRVKGTVKVKVRPFSGVSIRWISCEFTLGNIISNTKVISMGEDVSADVNDFFGNFVLQTIRENYRDINQLLEIVLFDIIDENL